MGNFTYLMEKAMSEFSANGAFLTVKQVYKVNSMTISWGFIGFMWNKPHFITVVRPQRYTKELLDGGADCFTVSIPFDGNLRNELSICGTKSGRDINKSEIVKWIPSKTVGCPVVEGCGLYYECKINLAQQLDKNLLAEHVTRDFYSDDFHFMYVGEIVETYGK